MKKELLNLARKYELKEIVEKINYLDSVRDLKVGFLGEFASGKSTLLNAMMGQKILPATENRTTASITHIVPKANIQNNKFFQIDEKGNLVEIDKVDFEDIATGRKEKETGKRLITELQIPENKYLPDGYLFVDTPGLNAMQDTDTDITYGYLPLLNGAVICLHSKKGTIPQSILDFLAKKEIRPFLKYFIFAITQADKINSKEGAEKIRENVIERLTAFYKEQEFPIENIEKRVVLTSIINGIEFNPKYDFKLFTDAMQEIFVSQREEITALREKKELEIIAKEIFEILTFKNDNWDLSNKELENKQKQIKEDLKKIGKTKDESYQKLDALKSELKKIIRPIISKYADTFKKIDVADFDETVSSFLAEIDKFTQDEIQRFYEEIDFENVDIQIEELKENILKTTNIKDLAVTIVSAIVFAYFSPLKGAKGNMVEALATSVLRKFPKIKNATVILDLIHSVSKVFDKVNPFEYLGNFISSKVIASQIDDFLQEISEKLPEEIIANLKMSLDKEIFDKIESELNGKIKALTEIKESIIEDFKIRKEFKISLENDVKTLGKMI